MKQQNDAARDLWAQIFERAAADPNATLHKPDEESEAAQRELTIRALKEAGWSEAEIKRRIDAERFHNELENTNSPGVGPGLEFRLRVLADRVQRVISESGEASHKKVEVAIDPKAGVSASLTHVIMTDQAILTVSSFFFRWCGLIARAYTRTIYADVAHWAYNHSDSTADRDILLKRPDLVFYWFRIFVSFSGTGTHALVPYRPSSPTEIILFEQVAWAMEYFTVAHEFGHHVLWHRSVDADPKVQEFQADAFAVKVCEQLEFEPFPHLSNPYTRTGAGASLTLLAGEILRTFEGPAGDDAARAETHPSPTDRIAKLSARNLMRPKHFAMDLEFNGTVTRIMNAVSAIMQDLRSAVGDEFVAFIKQEVHKAEMELNKPENLQPQ